MASFRRAWLLSLVFVTSACASASTTGGAIKPSSPFLEADRTLFEDGVDLVADPESLTGRWADDWATELRDRVDRSDLIAILTVNTLRSDVNPEQRTTHWLVAEVGDVFKGSFEGELSLPSSDDAIGFDSIDRERSNILKRPLVLFAKWVRENDTGTVRPRWHLAVGSRDVVDAVRMQIAGTPKATRTEVIEHTQ